jgi:hypothetical protein
MRFDRLKVQQRRKQITSGNSYDLKREACAEVYFENGDVASDTGPILEVVGELPRET